MAVEISNINQTSNNSAIMLPPTITNFTAASNINTSGLISHNKAHSSNPTKSHIYQ